MVWNISNNTTVELNNMTLSVGTLRGNILHLNSTVTVGVGVTGLGTNAPSGLLSLTVGGWAKVILSNGSTGYLPVWV